MKTGKTAKTRTDFIRKWKAASDKIDHNVVQKMMEGVQRKVR